MEELHGSPGTEQQDEGGGPPIDVDDEVGLINALKPKNAGRTILVGPGTYRVGVPLTVPDRATVQGAGMMLFDAQGLPKKFDPQIPTTTITASSDLKGNLVTLGYQSLLRSLILEGANQVGLDAEGRGGNVVAIASRAQQPSISATIEDCELINKLKSGGGRDTDGPTGGAILAYTRNPQREAAPPPHEAAQVTLTLTRSIVRAPKGTAIFAMNFASRGMVTVNLTKNEIGGPLDVIGGLSRPDGVHNAKTTIHSNGNHYSPQGESNVKAWQIVGGSSSPIGGNANTDSNSATVESKDDQIENFQVGIEAIGGRRLPGNGTCSKNEVELKLVKMTLATKPPGTAKDFVFEGARSSGPFPAGNNNTVVAEVLAGTTPDRLFRIDVHEAGFGTGNQLAFTGTLAAFTQSP
jgi:hypothetical protein